MTFQNVLEQLEEYGTEQNRKIYSRHGCDIEQYGVSMAHLKKIVKQIKNDKELGKELFLSQNADAIYLSQWVVDINDLTTEEIEDRILTSNYYMLIENAIPSVVVKDLNRTKQYLSSWLTSSEPRFRQCGYSLYSIALGIYPDDEFDLQEVEELLEHIRLSIHDEANRVRYTMNNFVISVGTYIKALSQKAIEVAEDIGTVQVNMGETSCKVPLAKAYIEKVQNMNRVGKKRKQ